MTTLTFPNELDQLHPDARAAFDRTYKQVYQACASAGDSTTQAKQKALLAAFGSLRRLCDGMAIKGHNNRSDDAAAQDAINFLCAMSAGGMKFSGGIFKTQVKRLNTFIERHERPIIPAGFYDELDKPKPTRAARWDKAKMAEVHKAVQKQAQDRERMVKVLTVLYGAIAAAKAQVIDLLQPHYPDPANAVKIAGCIIPMYHQRVRDSSGHWVHPTRTRHGKNVGDVIPVPSNHGGVSIGYLRITKITDRGIYGRGAYDKSIPEGRRIYLARKNGKQFAFSTGTSGAYKADSSGMLTDWPIGEVSICDVNSVAAKHNHTLITMGH